MLFLALALPAIYAYAPSLEGVAKLRWLDDIGVFITKSLAPARPEANASAVDPVAAANLDEDLDYRIAQRTKSTEGWRSFLTAHPDGPHAQSARAELDKLVPPETPPAPAAQQAPDVGPADTKTLTEVASPGRPSAGSETTTPTSDESCTGDEDRLEQLSKSPTGDGVIRFLIELRCEKLRPRLLRLAERLDDQPPKAVPDAGQGAHPSVLPGPVVVPAAPLPPPRMRANESQNRTRSTLASRGVQQRRHANPSTAPSLPPILLALFGEQPRHSAAFRRTRAGGRFGTTAPSRVAGAPAPQERAAADRTPVGTIDAGLAIGRLSLPSSRRRAGRIAISQSTMGFWPPSMDKVTPVM